MTARRADTRRRLLDAALEVFAEDGFGRATVERVCERAGFTRGAFYSNFSSLDELFLAMWQERSARMVDELRSALADMSAVAPDATLRAALKAIPLDDTWQRVTAEFTAHALRVPALRREVAARERAIRDALLPVLVEALARAGRRVPDRTALGRALVAVHDGTAAQVLLEPGDAEAVRRREELFLHVLAAYSTPAGDGTDGPWHVREPADDVTHAGGTRAAPRTGSTPVEAPAEEEQRP
ncbi:TetR/AcrR family transcriptional regulator [Streptomyces sp. NPDC054784]